jgi:transposase
MKRFVEGENRQQMILLPDCLDDYVVEDNPVRVIDVFIDELDLAALGFEGMLPATTGRPAYHPATLLKIYLYGYLNRIPSSRRLERETQRNIELMWLTAGFQDDCRFPQGQWGCNPRGLPTVHGAVPSAQSVHRGCRCG